MLKIEIKSMVLNGDDNDVAQGDHVDGPRKECTTNIIVGRY